MESQGGYDLPLSGIQFVKLPPGEGNPGDFLDESFTGMVKEAGIDAAIVGCGC